MVKGPSFRLAAGVWVLPGPEQGANAPGVEPWAKTRHAKVDASLAEKPNVGLALEVFPLGPELIVTIGAVVSPPTSV